MLLYLLDLIIPPSAWHSESSLSLIPLNDWDIDVTSENNKMKKWKKNFCPSKYQKYSNKSIILKYKPVTEYALYLNVLP